MKTLGMDEIGAKYVADQRLLIITGIILDTQKECIEECEKQLAAVKDRENEIRDHLTKLGKI